MNRTCIDARCARTVALSLFALVCATSSAVADLSHDVRQLSGVLAEQATEASLKIGSHSEAVRVKGIFENLLNNLARTNNLIAVPSVQTFGDKKQIGIGFVTISKPPIVIQIAARNGELLIEYASCGDQILVNYDSRTELEDFAEELNRFAANASRLDKQQAERMLANVEPTAVATKVSLEMLHEPGLCSITASRPRATIYAWALDGDASVHVSTE